ncbi:hypothetical protein FHS97_002577 [Sphingomonas endophytica]|uniref:Ferritin-like domain-containing protein n=1 Tax=Sphingomonas endophytica TaxID=869719 RepID=A0ABR6N759_9SPHN|nr:ferritin-like domain-containing protein [Sphingomonas endophytica]MBB5726634.1 hypothetical protein [Sphingomonas endophytica]
MIDRNDIVDRAHARRAFLKYCGGAATVSSLAMLAGCGSDKYGAEVVQGTPAPAPTAAPSYTATDTDYLNFLLQIQYLTAGFFWRSAFGGSIASSLLTGAGSAGAITGGAQVQFTDDLFMQGLREVALAEVARLGQLRSLIGASVTAQPVISIAGGSGSPFDAIASRDAFPSGTPFDPYASLENYLLGASALSYLCTSAARGIVFRLTTASNRDEILGIIGGKAYADTFFRLALWRAGLSKSALYDTENKMVLARNKLNGGDGTYLLANYECGVGSAASPTIVVLDNVPNNANYGALLARTPDLVLNIAYASKTAVTSGGFFPGGVNGTIKYSNAVS